MCRCPMALPLHESQAVAEMAKLLYDFLPGSGDPSWKGYTTFATVSRSAGVGDFWPGGSKRPAIARLLERTLEERRERFQPLVVAIVRAGLNYRAKTPVTKSEILTLNELIKKIGFKFPELWDPAFLDSLAAPKLATEPSNTGGVVRAGEADRRDKLSASRNQFYALASQTNRQEAGTAFERVLHDLFALAGLQPRLAYRVTGEQIDGSFVLDQETYLLEAKWEAGRLSEAPLLVFREKISGKSTVTRGVFVAANGYTNDCLDAITRGKQPNFFLIDGYDLAAVLEDQIDLVTLLRTKLRLLAETGAVLGRVSPNAAAG